MARTKSLSIDDCIKTFTLEEVKDIVNFEGGYSDRELDRGGETAFGVTKTAWDSLGLWNDEKWEQLKHAAIHHTPGNPLSKEEAELITTVYKYYWQKSLPKRLRGQVMPRDVANIVMDIAFNCGPGGAVAVLQRACNSLHLRITVDGAYGPKTAAAFEKLLKDAQSRERILQAWQLHYARICEARPAQLCHLRGWLNRTWARITHYIEEE